MFPCFFGWSRLWGPVPASTADIRGQKRQLVQPYRLKKSVDRKKRVVDRYFHSSRYVEEMYRAMGTTFAASGLLDPEQYQAVGGSFPLLLQGAGVIGSITVCGLSGEEDHNLCVQGIREYLQIQGREERA